jgi:ATP-dependent Lon protease
LDIPFDLSNVLFITTANQLDTIPSPLLDRMEVIRLSGYILEDKVEIARRFLIPKLLKEHHFEADEIIIEEDALRQTIDHYAREAGVRNLEKQLRKIIRKITLRLAEEKEVSLTLRKEDVEAFLGKPVFQNEQLYARTIAGTVMGLAYTALGGSTLYIEASGIRSTSSGFKQTGQLGKVMQESAEIAFSYIRAKLSEGVNSNSYFNEHFVHLHVPAGATPKDGPSAGITMAIALYSLATGEPVRK